jgi:hypothetical protein
VLLLYQLSYPVRLHEVRAINPALPSHIRTGVGLEPTTYG